MIKPRPCSVDGCERPRTTIELCAFHWRRKRNGIPLDQPLRVRVVAKLNINKQCSIEDCDGPAFSRTWCRFHYERWRHTGDPIPTCPGCGATLPLRRSKWCSNRCKIQSPERKDQRQAYLADNAEAIKAKDRVRRAKNFERDRAAQRAWCKAHPERVREKSNQGIHRRRARLKGRISEPVTIAYLYERDNGRCGLCGGKVSLKRRWPDLLSPSKDHILPIAKGGDDSRANKQLAHLGCNLKKNTKGGDDQLRLLG